MFQLPFVSLARSQGPLLTPLLDHSPPSLLSLRPLLPFLLAFLKGYHHQQHVVPPLSSLGCTVRREEGKRRLETSAPPRNSPPLHFSLLPPCTSLLPSSASEIVKEDSLLANKGGGGNEQYYRYEPSPPYTCAERSCPPTYSRICTVDPMGDGREGRKERRRKRELTKCRNDSYTYTTHSPRRPTTTM